MGLVILLSLWALGACVLGFLAFFPLDIIAGIVTESLWGLIMWRVHAETLTVAAAGVWSVLLFGGTAFYAYRTFVSFSRRACVCGLCHRLHVGLTRRGG